MNKRVRALLQEITDAHHQEEAILAHVRGIEIDDIIKEKKDGSDGGQLEVKDNLRVYLESNALYQRVRRNYLAMHTHQTYDFMQLQVRN